MHKLLKCPCCDFENEIKSKRIIIDYQNNQYLICKNCNSWYQLEKFKKHYGLCYFTQATDPDGNLRNMLAEREFKIRNWFCETVEYVNSKRPGLILDVGAGLGYFLSAVDSRWKKYANESSDELIGFLKTNYPEINLVQKLNHEFIEKYRNKFDVIILYHVIEHLQDPNEMMKILYQLLKNNGELIIGTPNIGSFCAFYFKGNFRLLGDGHLCLYNKKSLIALAKKSGFNFLMIKYPFFNTKYFSLKNLLRLFNRNKVSPPFYGSVMNLYFQVQK